MTVLPLPPGPPVPVAAPKSASPKGEPGAATFGAVLDALTTPTAAAVEDLPAGDEPVADGTGLEATMSLAGAIGVATNAQPRALPAPHAEGSEDPSLSPGTPTVSRLMSSDAAPAENLPTQSGAQPPVVPETDTTPSSAAAPTASATVAPVTPAIPVTASSSPVAGPAEPAALEAPTAPRAGSPGGTTGEGSPVAPAITKSAARPLRPGASLAASPAEPAAGTAGTPAASPVAGTSASAATAGPAATHQTPVADQVWPVVPRLVARGDGTHRITLRLHPADLGEVRVTVTVKGGKVDVMLAAGADAREALREGGVSLRSLLEGTGRSAGHLVLRDLSGTVAPADARAVTDLGSRPDGRGSAGPGSGGGDASSGGHHPSSGQPRADAGHDRHPGASRPAAERSVSPSTLRASSGAVDVSI